MESKFYFVVSIMQLLGCMDPDLEASESSGRTIRTSSIETVADTRAARKPSNSHNDSNVEKQVRTHRTFVPTIAESKDSHSSTKAKHVDPATQNVTVQAGHDRFDCLSPEVRKPSFVKTKKQNISDQDKKPWSMDSGNTTIVGELPTFAQFVAMRKSQSSSPNNVSFRSDTRTTARTTPYTVPGAVSSDSLNTQQEVIAEAEKIQTEGVERLVIMGHLYYQQSKSDNIEKYCDLQGNSVEQEIIHVRNLGKIVNVHDKVPLTVKKEVLKFYGKTGRYRDGTIVTFQPNGTVDYWLGGRPVSEKEALCRPGCGR